MTTQAEGKTRGMEKRVMTIILRSFILAIGVTFITVSGQAQNLLNGGFEIADGIYTNVGSMPGNPDYITDVATNWVQFANGIRTNEIPAHSGSYTLKCYGSGCYGGGWDGEGADQVISNGVVPGATYTLTAYGWIPSGDALTNNSPVASDPQPFGYISLSFRNSGGTPVGSTVSANWHTSDGTDTWISRVITGTAPASAAQVVVYVMELGPFCYDSGAIFFDDLSLVNLNAPIITNFYQMAISPGNQICWLTQPNASYQAQGSLNNLVWTNVGDLIAGDGNTNCTFDISGQKFYRVLEMQ